MIIPFDKMPLFMLMEWAEKHNYDEDYAPIVVLPGEFNPFETAPEGYDEDQWDKELLEFEKEFIAEYRASCKKICQYREKHLMDIDKVLLRW